MNSSTNSSGEGVQWEAPARAIDWRSPALTCQSTPLPPILPAIPANPEPRYRHAFAAAPAELLRLMTLRSGFLGADAGIAVRAARLGPSHLAIFCPCQVVQIHCFGVPNANQDDPGRTSRHRSIYAALGIWRSSQVRL
jgi:hypothetical protein